jgi:hypothetical protein
MQDNPAQLALPDSKFAPKYETIGLLMEQGLTAGKAAQAIGLTKQRGYQIAKKFDLTNRKHLALASARIKNILQCEPYGAMDKIKDSTVLAAAQMVYDRAQPVKRDDSGGQVNNYTQINLQVFNGTAPQQTQPIDITGECDV